MLLSLLPAVACNKQPDWVEYRGKNGSGYTPTQLYPPLGLRWKLKLQDNSVEDAKSFNPPVLKDDTLYFGSNDGNFYALDPETGYMRWIFPTKGKVNSVPFADDERVYFGSNDTKVYALDRETGKLEWDFQTTSTVQSLVLRTEDLIIFTSDTGATYFLNPDGKEVNRIPNPVWSHHTFQVYEGVVYWAPQGRRFGAYDIEERRFLWTVDVNVPWAVWYSFPAVDDENVYFASNFYKGSEAELNYYAMNRTTGETVWEVQDFMDLGSMVPANRNTLFLDHVPLLDYMAPALYKDFVIFTSGDRIVRAFHKETGKVAWTYEFSYPTSSAPTVAGDRVYLGVGGSGVFTDMGFLGSDPKLVCLDAEDGTVLWEMDVQGEVLSAPIIAGKRMTFGTSKHYFYVLEEIF